MRYPGDEPVDPAKRTRNSFRAMWERCTNQNARTWARYGGRGITVCARWKSYDAFVEDMGLRPAGTTIDRYPNENGNYESGNCRWATPVQQAWTTRGRENHGARRACKLRREKRVRIGLNRLWAKRHTLYGSGSIIRMEADCWLALEEEFGLLPPELPHSYVVDLTVIASPYVELGILDRNRGGASLEEIGAELGVTRERVRQIEVAALTKLRRIIERERAAEAFRAPRKKAA